MSGDSLLRRPAASGAAAGRFVFKRRWYAWPTDRRSSPAAEGLGS